MLLEAVDETTVSPVDRSTVQAARRADPSWPSPTDRLEYSEDDTLQDLIECSCTFKPHVLDLGTGPSAACSSGSAALLHVNRGNFKFHLSRPHVIGLCCACRFGKAQEWMRSEHTRSCGYEIYQIRHRLFIVARARYAHAQVRLAIDAHISVLSVGVSVPINRNISVECPTNQLEGVIKSITGAVGDIGSAISRII